MSTLMTVLDYCTAEPFLRSTHRDPYTRFSTLPRDVIDSIAPYLHTHVTDGHPYRDDQQHGTCKWSDDYFYGSHKYVDGEPHGYAMMRHADGSMCGYSEWLRGEHLLTISWSRRPEDDGVEVREVTHEGYYRCTVHTTMPTEYRYVWEIMTRTDDI